MLVPVSAVQLAIIPDEWTGLPVFVPGERDLWKIDHDSAVVRVTVRAGEFIIPAAKAMELLAKISGDAARKAEVFAEMVRRGIDPLTPAVPAHRLEPGNTYRFHSGGVVVQ